MSQYKDIIILIAIVFALSAIAAFTLPGRSSTKGIQTPNFAQNFQGTAIVTATNSGYNVSNVTIINPFSLKLNGTSLSFHITYITPNSTGLVVNNSVYALYMNNQPVLVRNTSAYSFYAKLTGVSYYSKQQSVTIFIYSARNPPAPIVNNNYVLAANTPLTIEISNSTSIAMKSAVATSLLLDVTNATNSTRAPAGYATLLILNVSASTTNVTISITTRYQCSLQNGRIAPYKLAANRTWMRISQFTLNATACTATFTIPSDPVVGLFYSNKSASAPTSATVSSTIAATTATAAMQQSAPGSNAVQIAAAIIIVLIIIAIAYYALAGKRGKWPPGTSNKQQQAPTQSK